MPRAGVTISSVPLAHSRPTQGQRIAGAARVPALDDLLGAPLRPANARAWVVTPSGDLRFCDDTPDGAEVPRMASQRPPLWSAEWARVRRQVAAAMAHATTPPTCPYCQLPIAPGRPWDLDHRIQRGRHHSDRGPPRSPVL